MGTLAVGGENSKTIRANQQELGGETFK